MLLGEIARALKADVDGNAHVDIRRVAKIEDASEGDITFLANPRYTKFLASTEASAVIVGREVHWDDADAGRRAALPALVRVDDPYASFLKTLVLFNPPKDPLPPGIHPASVVHPTAELGPGVRVGANAVIGARCTVGAGAMISAGTVLGDDVAVGARTLLHPNVTVRDGCRIGARVIIHSGTVVGSDGFGFAPLPDGTFEKIPQVGIVVVEDDVEIGANCAIDRATLGETVIRKGAKLDNLIQIAHNVVVGENTVIAAQTGISGSTKLGNNVMMAGQVGITGHLDIADRTKIGAQSGVHRSITSPGGSFFGSPAAPQREALRIAAAMTHLPDLLGTVRELKAAIEKLESELREIKKQQ